MSKETNTFAGDGTLSGMYLPPLPVGIYSEGKEFGCKFVNSKKKEFALQEANYIVLELAPERVIQSNFFI